MSYIITKSSQVFDREKVGVGDVIEFNEYSVPFFGKPKVLYRKAGIVTKVEPHTIWIRTHDDYFKHTLDEIGIGIERAEEIRMVYRSAINVKDGEPYGENIE